MKKIINRFLALLLLSLSLFACGGGTAGTSGPGIKSVRFISGSVEDTEGTPVVGAKVTVAGESKETTTNQEGQFGLEEETESNFTLEINHQGNIYKLNVSEVEAQTEVVNLSAVLDSNNITASSESVEGEITLLDCQDIAQVRGNELKLNLPTGASSCFLAYEFRVRRAQPKDATLKIISSNNCGGISFVQTGTQVSGENVRASQALYVTSKQRGVCSAKVSASFPGLKGNPVFNLKITKRR